MVTEGREDGGSCPEECPEFGLVKKIHLYEKLYTNEWVVIYSSGSIPTSAGRFDRIEDNHVILNPYQDGRCRDDGSMELSLIDNPEVPESIPLIGIGDIRPSTERSIINYCNKQNKSQKSDCPK